MKKVLHIVSDLIRGGTEGQCARAVMGLARRARSEHRVAVFYRRGFFLEPVERACGPVIEIPIRKLARCATVAAVARLSRHMRREEFGLVHTWDAESAIFGGAATLLAGIPLVTSRRDLGQIYPRWKQWVLRAMDQRAARVVVNARAIESHFVKSHLAPEKIVRIPNIVEIGDYPSDAIRAPGPSGAPLSIICVARMDPEKGLSDLIRAFALFAQSPAKARLVLVGDGIERPALERLAAELELAGCVEFLGDRTDVPSLLRDSDVAALTPVSNEGLSNSILEYMAAGLPVVCTDCGGNAELVLDGVNGYVLQPGDTAGMANAFRLLLDESLRHRMGRESRRRIEDNYTPEHALPLFEYLYESLR